MIPSLSPKNPLWQFIDDSGTFRVDAPNYVSRLYFPLANEAGILSSITPDLNGDIKTDHNCFLTLPVSAEDLHNTKSNRNFWVHIAGHGAWSLTGISSAQDAAKFSPKNHERATLEAGMLWHKVTRTNSFLGLKSEITNFAPTNHDPVEIMIVSLTNTSKETLQITPTSAIPIFGRSADNLRDHHHVTSLLHRIINHPAGVVVKPTMSFDERGHKINQVLYAVVGTTQSGELPVGYFSTVESFIDEGGDFENPRAIYENRPTPPKENLLNNGKPAIGALRFRTISLAPGEKTSYVLILGITSKEADIDQWVKNYGSLQKAENALKENKIFWANKASTIKFKSQEKLFNGWARWTVLQPTFRKLYGCSFLPDFDYGRGGRGWRDLWQDCLALLLSSATDAKKILLNNYGGVRIDGSNATIIGQLPGEFIADRNNITRVWMDHGTWPFLTTELYIHQTGDFGILFEEVPYFRDRQQSRARKKDKEWTEDYGKNLKSKSGRIIKSSVLEHILVQHLVQFYNVGKHNHIRLENADWNDGLDMAYERGESVAFTSFYAWNLKKIALLLVEIKKRAGVKKITLLKEVQILLDRTGGKKINYNSVAEKNKCLQRYFDATQPEVSGKTVSIPIDKLILDLTQKSDFIIEHLRKTEWIQIEPGKGIFNGYYDNHERRVEGHFQSGFRMTLTGQVFPIMGGIASFKQIGEIFSASKQYLKDKEHGGFRLNTDFHEIRPDLGRAFSFAYGEKENGAFFSHMAVMYANALYQRNFVNEGHEVLDSIFRMCVRTHTSKIFPGIPEYFNSQGRGLYHYLTGSASWLVMTLLTQVYGVRGHYGDLLLAPKFIQNQFAGDDEVSVETFFAGKRIKVVYVNPKKISFEHYTITSVSINGKDIKNLVPHSKEALIPKSVFLNNCKKAENTIVVTLG